MNRPSWNASSKKTWNPPGSPGRNQNPGNDSYGHRDDDAIIVAIKQCKNLYELNIEDITKEDGLAEKFAKKYKNDLKATQLRKFFDKIVTNRENLKTRGWKSIESDFHMIRPNLAYAKGRKLIPEAFFELISLSIQRIAPAGADEETVRKNYDRFVDILQSIVAYHKFFGGK